MNKIDGTVMLKNKRILIFLIKYDKCKICNFVTSRTSALTTTNSSAKANKMVHSSDQ